MGLQIRNTEEQMLQSAENQSLCEHFYLAELSLACWSGPSSGCDSLVQIALKYTLHGLSLAVLSGCVCIARDVKRASVDVLVCRPSLWAKIEKVFENQEVTAHLLIGTFLCRDF